MKRSACVSPVAVPNCTRSFRDPSIHFPVSRSLAQDFLSRQGKAEAWLPPLRRQGPDIESRRPTSSCSGKRLGRGGPNRGRRTREPPSCAPPEWPGPAFFLLLLTPPGTARGARAWALREGIRNSEIKCISLGNAPHSADQIKRIKVQGGGKKLFRTEGGKTSPKGRETEMEEGSAVQMLRSRAPFLNYFQFWKSPPPPPKKKKERKRKEGNKKFV